MPMITRITLNTYGHLYPSEQEKVADMLDRMAGTNGNFNDVGKRL